MTRASCWEGYEEPGPLDHGWPSVIRWTCLLPDGHDGPHEFTPDRDIVVRLSTPDVVTPFADLRARLAPNAERMRAYALSESDPILADLLITSANDIDALLARGEAAEAVRRPSHDAMLRIVSDLRCPNECIQPDCSECLCEDAAEQIMRLL